MSFGKSFASACVLSLLSVASGCSSVSEDGTKWVGEEPVEQSTEAVISGINKMCSAITPNNWRDTILVPQAWSKTKCQQWASSISASQFQLGCAWEAGGVGDFSWGSVGGGLPPNNFCNWQP